LANNPSFWYASKVAMAPPLIVEKEHIDQIIDILKKIIPTH